MPDGGEPAAARASAGPPTVPVAADAALRHARLREIVLGADALSGAARERFVAERCAGDTDLERDVRDFLAGTPVATRDVLPAALSAAPSLSADNAQTPERLGPYRIVRELGRGGMGVVYEAEDERSGRNVAVKVIRTELLGNARAEERFAREAAAGAEVDHPNVVRTLGAERLADPDGRTRCVLVTELVSGRTLRDLLRALGTVPEALLREIARGLARGVAAIHAAGIVHRDLKPENVVLTDDGRVRVMDLGVARVLDSDDRLTREGDFVGSLEYASPEQCAGQPAGPAADLYAIGAILFELASGVQPFARESVCATIAAHLTAPAPPLAERAPHVSAFLAAVVAVLLAKDPADRFDSAETLVLALDEGEDGAWWRDRASREARSGAAAPRVPVAREMTLRGRDAALAALRAALDEAGAGEGSTVFVTGEPGLGKTRLLDAFLASVGEAASARPRARLLYGAVPATGGISGLGEALLDAVGPDRSAAWFAETAGLTPALGARFASHLRGEPPPTPAQALAPDVVASAYQRSLLALAAEGPVVVAIDDVHQAAPEAATLVVALARALSGRAVLFVLASRPEAAARWTAELASLPRFRSVALTRLSSEDIVEILRGALGSEALAWHAARRIAAKSGGVPLYVSAMLGALRDALASAPGDDVDRVIDGVDVPMALRGALEARLGGLTADERTLLDACSVQGVRFDAAVAAEVVASPPVRTLQILAAIERRVALVRADGRSFRFDHQLLAEHVEEALPLALREEYHLRTADAIAARRRPPPEQLASHYLASSRPALALPHLGTALEVLCSRRENESARRLADAALAADGLLAGRERATLLLRVAELRNLAGDRDAQEAAAREALTIARAERDASLLAGAHRAVATHLAATGGDRRAVARFRAAIRLAHCAGAAAVEVRAKIGLGASLMRLGRVDAAGAADVEACDLAERIGDQEMLQLAKRSLGLLDLRIGRFEEARRLFRCCAEIGRTTGDLRAEGHADGGLGVVEWHAGNWDAARELFLRARDAARAVGDRSLETHALGSLSIVFQAVGRCTEAIAANRELRPLLEAVGDRAGLALLLLNVSQAHLHVGDRAASLAALDEAEVLAEATGFALSRAQAALCRGEHLHEAGDFAAAEERYLAAAAILESADNPLGRVEALLCLGSVAQDRGDIPRAAAWFDEAVRIGRDLERPATSLAALAARATLPGGDPDAACAAAAVHLGATPMSLRLRIRHDLWRATGDVQHLAEAGRLLGEFLERLPAADRRRAVENFRLHREIAAACAREGVGAPL